MARRTLQQNVDIGILTTYNVAHLLNVSPITVRRMIDRGVMPAAFKIPGTDEWRIPGPAIADAIRKSKMQMPQKIIEAETNYKRLYDSGGTPLERSETV